LPTEIGYTSRLETDTEGVSLEDACCANSIIRERASRIASVNWGSTAGLDTVQYKIPHYIMKGISRHPERETSALCIEMIVKLLLLGQTRLMTLETDDVGVYLKKGVKRTLAEAERNQSYVEPGCGNDYLRYHEEDDCYDSGSDTGSLYPYDEWGNEVDSDMELEGERQSQLNGSHGEWTESDDVAGKRGQRGGGGKKKRQSSTVPNRRTPHPNPKRAFKKAARGVAREAGIGFAANFIGAEAARGGYQMIARAMRPKTLSLSLVASRYLASFTTPFSTSVSQVNIPKTPATRSYKVTGFLRGTGYIGTTGLGFVAIAPSLCNNRPCVFYSTSAFGMSTIAPPPNDKTFGNSALGAGQYPATSNMTNLPYTFDALTSFTTAGQSDISGRIVSCSLRVYYTGTTLNESGQYLAYSDPDCVNVLGDQHDSTTNSNGYNSTGLSQKDACEILNVRKDKEVSIVVTGVNEDMDDYARASAPNVRKTYPLSSLATYTDSASAICGVAPAVVMVTGVKEMPFYFEMVTHAEFIGPGVVQALLSDTEVDVVGYDAVKNVLQHAQREVAANPRLTFKNAVNQELRRQHIVAGTGHRSVDY